MPCQTRPHREIKIEIEIEIEIEREREREIEIEIERERERSEPSCLCVLPQVTGQGTAAVTPLEGGGADLSRRVDLIVSEIADEGLLGEEMWVGDSIIASISLH